jgi:hypothetical protein
MNAHVHDRRDYLEGLIPRNGFRAGTKLDKIKMPHDGRGIPPSKEFTEYV